MGHGMARMRGLRRVSPGSDGAGKREYDEQTSVSWTSAVPATSGGGVHGAVPGVVEDEQRYGTLDIDNAIQEPGTNVAGQALRTVTCEFWGGSWYRILGAGPGEWTRWRSADEVEDDGDGGGDEENSKDDAGGLIPRTP
eukprot:TRINITY_DN8117_c1_g4_i1.p1 TRINITY_DN8117_c1_g4~~TRINITY_DN8117_c1_g4_i1.p1  ORF type:complete len:139 (-),score=27.47 TRINITY_DN8117_c1_g4_i1:58-474(-)